MLRLSQVYLSIIVESDEKSMGCRVLAGLFLFDSFNQQCDADGIGAVNLDLRGIRLPQETTV